MYNCLISKMYFLTDKLFIQKQFLQIHSLFDASKPRHLLNKIFIADYCNWISDAQEIMLKVLADQISKLLPPMSDSINPADSSDTMV
ncbi:hypothetical protein C0J52_10883 [Blattella germanica]|nr:hypothetical protein C0J52_10883 [Blattella germanica]